MVYWLFYEREEEKKEENDSNVISLWEKESRDQDKYE